MSKTNDGIFNERAIVQYLRFTTFFFFFLQKKPSTTKYNVVPAKLFQNSHNVIELDCVL
jgi:hypothetical protein